MSPPDGTTGTTTGTEGTAAAATAAAATSATAATAAAATGTTAATGTGTAAATGQTGTQAATGTTAATGTAGTTAATPKWSDDWRKDLARGDEKSLAHLGRYKDPEAVYDALKAAQARIDSGTVKTPLPENATPEQLAEYRKENGIPETPDKYDLTLPDGLVIGEADKPLIDSFLKDMHGGNATPGEVKRALAWYYKQNDAIRQGREEADASFKETSIAELGKKYGAEYKRNVALVDQFLEGAPAGVKDKILGARLPNGRLAGSDPEFIDFLLDQARFRNPIPSAIGGNSEAQIKTAQTRVAELTKLSGDRNSDYWKKGPTGAALQKELLDLNEGLDKLKAKRR